MTDLDRLTKDYYAGAGLDAARVEAILAATPVRATPPAVWYRRIAAVAATLLVAAWLAHGYVIERDLGARVFAEIAMNHNKRLAVEVAASDFAAIGGALDRLDFAISVPGGPAAGLTLLGGRYCSIQGRLAAQLKLDDNGFVRTLYIAELTPELAALGATTAVHDGVAITLWNDGSVLYGLAGDAE